MIVTNHRVEIAMKTQSPDTQLKPFVNFERFVKSDPFEQFGDKLFYFNVKLIKKLY